MIQWVLRLTLPVVAGLYYAPNVRAEVAEARPQFEVASIKLNKECAGPSGPSVSSSGRLSVRCVSLRNLIGVAYTSYEGPNLSATYTQIVGGPAWLGADYYQLTAKAEGRAHRAEMEGPMLRALLEERFKVKVHKESRNTPVYALAVAKNNPKLQALKDGGCLPYDTDRVLEMRAPAKASDPKYCGTLRIARSPERSTTVANYYGITMAEFAGRMIRPYVDRPIIDKTALTGRYDIRLEFVEGAAPTGMILLNGVPVTDLPKPTDDSPGPSIFTALLEQLGLKLTPDRGPIEVLVIDHAERPSAN